MEGKRTILDIKTSKISSPATAIQLSAYLGAFNEGKKQEEKATQRLAIHLNEKGEYKLKKYIDKNDINIFIAALSIFNWRKKNNLLDKI